MEIEYVVASFDVMSCHLPEETEERFQEPLPGKSVYGHRSELDKRGREGTN
jgi:hypothetical protein